MRRSQRFSLGAYALVLGFGIAALSLGDSARHVDANDFPPLPPGLVSASPPSGLTPGQGVSPSVTEQGALRVVIDTPGGADVDVTQAQPTYPYLSTSWTVNDVSCTSAGTVVALADSAGAAKQRSFSNVSGATIYIGPSSGVTTSNGFAIPSGAAPSNPAPGYTGPVYCYAASTVSLGVSQLQ
jgi:hypothetical protein